MTPDILLNQNAILKAIHSVYCLEYASEYEEAGESFPAGTRLEEWVTPLRDELALPFAWFIIGRIRQAWGPPVGLVFHHAGIETETDQSRALSDLFLGIVGHGVTLADDFDEAIEKAEGILHCEFKRTPIYWEPDQLRELAREQLREEGITPREYGEEEE